jgi:ABC-type uncharacterized transport system substrate-binding protein
VRRRDFITLVGGAAAGWPLTARAQQSGKVPRIGFLGMASPSTLAARLEAFRLGLHDFGYVEGTNITVEYRWADEHYERLPKLAEELVRSNVDLIVTHGTPGTLAARGATATIPIVMAVIGDAVASGVAVSIARPGGNITGQSFFGPEIRAKRIELLKEVVPQLTNVAVLLSADNPASVPEFRAIEMTAQALNLSLQPYRLREPSEFVSAFESMEQARVGAVETGDDLLFVTNVGAITALAARARLPSIGPADVARTGGMMGYGVDLVSTFRRAAFFVDRILKGANPGDLPIERASKFQLVLNLKTAKALGLIFPITQLGRVDEVIE